ncbi:MAG: hypothetical protein V1487_04070, partial [bacterium]
SPPVDKPNTIHVPSGTSKPVLLELNRLLQDNRGDDQVTLIFEHTHGSRELVLPFGIHLTSELQSSIQTLLHVPVIEE